MEAITTFKEADNALLLATQAKALAEAGFAFSPGDFGLSDADPEALTRALQSAESQAEHATATLKPFEDAALLRLTCALQLVRSIQTAGRLEDADTLFDEAKELRWTLKRLVSAFGFVLQLRVDSSVLEALRSWAGDSASVDIVSHIAELVQSMRDRLHLLQERIASVPYPFPHPAGRISVSDFAKCREFHPDPTEMLLREVNAHVQNLIGLYYRIVARLIAISQKVEEVLPGKGV